MFKSKSNLKHFINLLNFFLKNYFFCRKSISEPADGPWLKSIFFYSNGFLFWLRKKIMEHLSVLADIYSRPQVASLASPARLYSLLKNEERSFYYYYFNFRKIKFKLKKNYFEIVFGPKTLESIFLCNISWDILFGDLQLHLWGETINSAKLVLYLLQCD